MVITPYKKFFGQKYFKTYALISLTKDIRKTTDEENAVCNILVDLQKAFNSVKHNAFS